MNPPDWAVWYWRQSSCGIIRFPHSYWVTFIIIIITIIRIIMITIIRIIITAIRIIITAMRIITLICHFLVVEVDPVSMSMFIWLQESDGSFSL